MFEKTQERATVTRTYAVLHRRFTRAALAVGVEPMVARVAAALAERGGSATTYELVQDLDCESSAVRRSAISMYAKGLATGEGVDGRQRRPGMVTRMALTDGGYALAAAALEETEEAA